MSYSDYKRRLTHDPKGGGRIGMVDIGSNSVRLVVYDQLKRAPAALYNEKVLCQLGRGLAITGKLNPDGVEMARAAIARFLAMAQAMEVTELDIVATAAVRDASDGKDFVAELEKRHHIHIDIISGKKEARLGAFGIFSSIHEPQGISGDLGGGSMELAQLSRQILTEQVTLPIGSLRLIDQTGGGREEMRALIAAELDKTEWLQGAKPENFYAIGGSFRAVARMHMLARGYPLEILHQYTVEAEELRRYVRELAALSEAELAALPGAAAKRVAAIPPAALILEGILATARPKQVVFSASGIREGYLHEKLSPYLRSEDVLLASCYEFAMKGGRGTAYAHELFEWMQPLFPGEPEAFRRLRFAACLLHDIARYIHPDHRAEWAMQRILQSVFVGLSHGERVQLALALYHRYQPKLKVAHPAFALIGAKEQGWARLLGAAMNLAYQLSGGIAGNLPETALKAGKHKLGLQLPAHLQALAGETVKKRQGQLEEAWLALGK